MNILSFEVGTRPIISTFSRRFAPEGVKVLAELLGHMQFADDGVVVLDWSNETGRQPAEVAKPVVFITTLKKVGEKILQVEVRLDVDDTFGRDQITGEDFLVIIKSLEDKTNAALAAAKES